MRGPLDSAGFPPETALARSEPTTDASSRRCRVPRASRPRCRRNPALPRPLSQLDVFRAGLSPRSRAPVCLLCCSLTHALCLHIVSASNTHGVSVCVSASGGFKRGRNWRARGLVSSTHVPCHVPRHGLVQQDPRGSPAASLRVQRSRASCVCHHHGTSAFFTSARSRRRRTRGLTLALAPAPVQELHHSKHHATYVANFNKVRPGLLSCRGGRRREGRPVTRG